MAENLHIDTDWPTLVAARQAYSVPLFEKGLCKVFGYEGKRYTTASMAFAVEENTQEARCYEVVPLSEYEGKPAADRIEPLRRHSYPGLIVKIEGTEEEVVITNYLLFLKADEPEEERQIKLLTCFQSSKNGKKSGTGVPVSGQLSLL